MVVVFFITVFVLRCAVIGFFIPRRLVVRIPLADVPEFPVFIVIIAVMHIGPVTVIGIYMTVKVR